MRIFDKLPRIDFMKYKGLAMAISWGVILICLLVAQPWKGTGGRVKLGMQFSGGIDMQIRFKGDMSQDKVRAALGRGGFPDASVVAYEAPEGFRDYSIKVKAREGQDDKDSTAQINKIREVLRALDSATTNDVRLDLNTESALALTDQWMKSNPLGVQGDEAALRAAYEPLVKKIVDTRDKAALLTSYSQLPQDLPRVLVDLIQKDYKLGGLAFEKQESFSPSISGEWTRKTLTAVAYALAAILLYVMVRFTMSYAVGGIVALIHDILMAVGIFTLFGFEYSVPVVASFLILIGYSMSDTIVVFDRIRENSRKPEYRRVSVTQLVNDSINQTLSRTLLTSMSTLFAASCLFFWGGPALRDISFPMVIGIITGTYSSIFIASPVLVYWEKWFPHKDNIKQKHA